MKALFFLKPNIGKNGNGYLLVVGLSGLLLSVSGRAQQSAASSIPKPPAAGYLPTVSIPAVEDVYCGDALSEALANTSPEMPCWADLRTTDRWRSAVIPGGELLRPQEDNGISTADFNRSSLTVGLTQGTVFVQGSNPQGYGAIVAGAVTAKRSRWRFSADEIGSGADLRVNGADAPVGLNLGTLRFTAEATPRLVVQARATNIVGTDQFRTLAPLDYQIVGNTEAPVPQTAAYGLHAGRVVDEQEDVSVRMATSRRTSWDFVAAHSLQDYSDHGTLVQTLRGRAQVLHAVTPTSSVGGFGFVETQTSGRSFANLPACSLSGGGVTSENRSVSNRLSFNLAAGVASATAGCGGHIQAIGDVAMSLRVGTGSSMYVVLNRDLSRGVLLTSPMLSSAGVGFRHSFRSGSGFEVGTGGLLGSSSVSPGGSTALFADAGAHFRLGSHIIQQTSIRRFQNSRIDRAEDGPAGQTILTFSLWLSRGSERAGTARN